MGLTIKAAKLIPILTRLGFRVVRQIGSHVHLEHMVNKSRKVTVPMHNKDLAIKTIKSILKQTGVSTKDFLKILRRE
ncbi:MAG TPA: type II toxin-antitoxin system HicA family toxin [Candidatus Paceibacterota bacterium]